MKTTSISCIFFLILFGGILSPLNAQEKIDKEVRVVKPYEPTLSGADKIRVYPELDDTLKFVPDFEYSIFPQPLRTKHDIRPIQAARLESDLLPELYKTYLKLGFGSYTTPLLEVGINSDRNKNGNLSLFARHMSSQGKVRLENDQRVFAGYSDTKLDLNGKKILKNIEWSGILGLNSMTRYFYGHRTDTLADPEKEDIKQRYLFFDTGTELKSTHGDSSRFNYKFRLEYGYTQDQYENSQHGFHLSGNGFRSMAKGIMGAEVEADHYRVFTPDGSGDNTLVSIYPWWMKSTPEYRIQIGLNLTVAEGDSTTIHFYPEAMLQFKVIEQILIPYIGIRGYMESNNLRKIATENPYIRPGLQVGNTNHNMEFYGGIKGNLGIQTSFTLRASYLLAENACFFVNDTLTELGNQFVVVYDDMEEVNYYGELLYRLSDKWKVGLKGNYYQYTTSVEEKAWHKYLYDASLSVAYNLHDKILLTGDVLAYGPRWAKATDPLEDPVKLQGYVDMNLKAEYRYTKILSGFVSLNNLTASKYQSWNQYPMQRFFFLLGFTYSM